MYKSIGSSIKCYIFHGSWCESVHDETIFTIYHCTHLIAPAVLAYHSPEQAYKSQHETILADLNWYMTATHLVIILLYDAIKHTCVW